MGFRKDRENPELGPNGNPLDPLSEKELETQAEISEILRAELEDILRIQIESLGLTDENTALMLSGGMESTALLFSLLKLGIRPTVVSYRGGGKKPSTDFRKAKYLAGLYDLPFYEVSLPEDPEKFYEHTKFSIEERGFRRRPDIEVTFLYRQVFKKIKEIGGKYIYSGIGEGNFVGLGREYETKGRNGELSALDRLVNQSSLISANQEQVFGIIADASADDLVLLTPFSAWGSLLTLADVPFRISNLPRKKTVVSRAYDKELENAKFVIKVSPMQTGDAGARSIFDDYVKNSESIQKEAEELGFKGKIDTAMKWYNVLKRKSDIPIRVKSETDEDLAIGEMQRNFANYAFTGAKIDEKYRELGLSESGINLDLFYSGIGESADLLFDEDSLLDDLEEDEEYESDSDYAPETLNYTDCLGVPLRSEYSMSLCPRARAGLCNHNPEAGPVTPEKDDTSYDIMLCGMAKLMIDDALTGALRRASYNQLYVSQEVADMYLQVYSYIAKRNQEIVDERARKLVSKCGPNPYGNGIEPGTFVERDGSKVPPIGILEGINYTRPGGIDRKGFREDMEDG